MNSSLLDVIFNSHVGKTVTHYWSSFNSLLTEFTVNESLTSFYSSLTLEEPFFDDFQWTLVKGFCGVLCINLLLIFITWSVFGKRICERFMKPATSKAIEELKASVSKLKLPKEHTPRI